MKFNKFAGLSHRYRISLLIGALVLIVCGAVFGRDRKLPVESASPRLVRSFTVISAQGGVAEYTGVIHARTESDLGFRVSGKILEKLVKAGDHVKRGQALMRLDPTDLRLAANAAREAVEAARAQNKRALADELRQRELVAIESRIRTGIRTGQIGGRRNNRTAQFRRCILHANGKPGGLCRSQG